MTDNVILYTIEAIMKVVLVENGRSMGVFALNLPLLYGMMVVLSKRKGDLRLPIC